MEHLLDLFRFRPRTRSGILLAGSLVFLIGFLILPLIYLLAVSFAARSAYGMIRWTFSVSNYAAAFQPLYLAIYWRSFCIALLTTVLCALLGYVVAYTIALRVSGPWRSVLLILVVIPFWTSFLIRTYAWMLILRTEGLMNNTLLALHLIHAPLRLLYTSFAVFIGLVYGNLPFMILPLYAALQKIDPSLLEAAQDLGAGPARAFRRVTLPLSRNGLGAGCVLVFIASLGAFITPDLLGGARSMMIGNLIQNQFAVARNQPLGSAVAFLLTFIVLVILLASPDWIGASLRQSERATREML